MLAPAIIGTIRTAVPAVIGFLIAWFVAQGFTIPADLVTEWTLALTTAATIGYYGLVTLLERKVWSGFGWLLGVASAPAYPDGITTDSRP